MGRNQRRRLQNISHFLGHRWLNWPVLKGVEPSIPHFVLDIDGATQDSDPSTLRSEYQGAVIAIASVVAKLKLLRTEKSK